MRNHTTLKKMTKQDDCYVDASPRERVSFIWQLTAELWSLKDKQNVEQRLQRNVTNLIRNKESTGREKDILDAKYLRGNHDT
ncbi:MAG: hypothetical protein H8D56_08220 [Planctomycetes bacterium]|nr:hypothetical protein [Planctomycetota bacterium]MBL7144269.1 hypothetical protein [Phycisphaerae bacterium]